MPAPSATQVSSPVPRRIRRPRWLDARLIAGFVLVVGAVLLGARVVSAADKTEPMWAAARDLAPGSVLSSTDVTSVRVRLAPGSHYLPAAVAVVGKTVARPLSAGELVPQSALEETTPATTVTVPLATANAPKISRGQRIELWVTTRACSALRVLDSVTVQDVQMAAGGAFATGSTQNVTVRLAPEHAQRLITALALDGAVVRAGILDGPSSSEANSHLPSLDACTVKR